MAFLKGKKSVDFEGDVLSVHSANRCFFHQEKKPNNGLRWSSRKGKWISDRGRLFLHSPFCSLATFIKHPLCVWHQTPLNGEEDGGKEVKENRTHRKMRKV